MQAQFSRYAVHEKFTGKPAPVALTRSEERYFRTMLRDGAKKGPNFAGHFTIVQWGCGTNCFLGAMVDAATGRVYQPPPRDSKRFSFRIQLHALRPDSRLLIICTDCREWLIGDCDQRYIIWDDRTETFTPIDATQQRDPHRH